MHRGFVIRYSEDPRISAAVEERVDENLVGREYDCVEREG